MLKGRAFNLCSKFSQRAEQQDKGDIWHQTDVRFYPFFSPLCLVERVGLTCSHLVTHLLDQAPGNEQWCTLCGSLRECSLRDLMPTSSRGDSDTQHKLQARCPGEDELICSGFQTNLTNPEATHSNAQWWRASDHLNATTQAGECVLHQAPQATTAFPLMRTGRKQATSLPLPLSLKHLKHCPKSLFSSQCLQVTSLIN